MLKPIGPRKSARFPEGLARTLSAFTKAPTPLRALRRLGATLARHRIGRASACPLAFPVPGGVAHVSMPGASMSSTR